MESHPRMDVHTTETYYLLYNKAASITIIKKENLKEEGFIEMYQKESGTLAWYGSLKLIIIMLSIIYVHPYNTLQVTRYYFFLFV